MKRNFPTEVLRNREHIHGDKSNISVIPACENDLFLAKVIKIWSKTFKNAFYFVIAVVKYNRKLLKEDQSQERQML